MIHRFKKSAPVGDDPAVTLQGLRHQVTGDAMLHSGFAGLPPCHAFTEEVADGKACVLLEVDDTPGGD